MAAFAPTADHLRLGAFEGRWLGEEDVAASAWTAAGKAVGEVETEMLFGGFFAEQRYRQSRDGKPSFEARNMLAFDTTDGSYKLYQFDSVGFAPQAPATGDWAGNELVLIKSSPRGRQRVTYIFDDEDRYRMRIEFSPAGSDAWQDMVSGTYRRAGSVSSNQPQEGL